MFVVQIRQQFRVAELTFSLERMECRDLKVARPKGLGLIDVKVLWHPFIPWCRITWKSTLASLSSVIIMRHTSTEESLAILLESKRLKCS